MDLEPMAEAEIESIPISPQDMRLKVVYNDLNTEWFEIVVPSTMTVRDVKRRILSESKDGGDPFLFKVVKTDNRETISSLMERVGRLNLQYNMHEIVPDLCNSRFRQSGSQGDRPQRLQPIKETA